MITIDPIDYARSRWPLGFTKPEMVAACRRPVRLYELVKQRAIQDTGVRRKGRVVYRYRPYQLSLPLEDTR